jgi:subtilisin family serine protease
MVIAVLDMGFPNLLNNPGFDSLFINGRILGTRNFVEPDSSFYWNSNGTHGSDVFSVMGGNIPGQYTGSAPGAEYWLIQTEDGRSEFRIEEANWLAGAELADSAGADIINSSLGYYNVFTDPVHNYQYSDMDGKTTLVTRAAQLAASRGILVVTSAGNEGRPGNPWGYVGAPADGDSVLAIGAVDASGARVDFSSYGPTYDNRIKPDVAAQGLNTWLINPAGLPDQRNGTSFSSPIVAGLAACLWQKNPEMTNFELLNAIRQSASLVPYPNNLLGYGIPNFGVANDILTGYMPQEFPAGNLDIYPNPAKEFITFNTRIETTGSLSYRITGIGGQVFLEGSKISNGNEPVSIPVRSLRTGLYILNVYSKQRTWNSLFVKD